MSLFDDAVKSAKKAKRRLAAKEPVPKSRDEAAAALGLMGDARRFISALEAQMESQIAGIRQVFEEKALPHLEKYKGLEEALAIFAEAHRNELTDNGKRQSADLGTGEFAWRKLPPKVSLRGVEDIKDWLEQMQGEEPEYGLFLRSKTEVNKEAMLADAERAAKVPGVSIGSEGEVLKILPLVEALDAARQTKPEARAA